MDPPPWLVRGRTVMILKDGCEGRPEQFQPINCLNTIYKLLTAMVATELTHLAIDGEILPPEQKALRKGTRGCLDAISQLTRQ
jgi:hypothetical protein